MIIFRSHHLLTPALRAKKRPAPRTLTYCESILNTIGCFLYDFT
jgi:hypothetical protein